MSAEYEIKILGYPNDWEQYDVEDKIKNHIDSQGITPSSVRVRVLRPKDGHTSRMCFATLSSEEDQQKLINSSPYQEEGIDRDIKIFPATGRSQGETNTPRQNGQPKQTGHPIAQLYLCRKNENGEYIPLIQNVFAEFCKEDSEAIKSLFIDTLEAAGEGSNPRSLLPRQVRGGGGFSQSADKRENQSCYGLGEIQNGDSSLNSGGLGLRRRKQENGCADDWAENNSSDSKSEEDARLQEKVREEAERIRMEKAEEERQRKAQEEKERRRKEEEELAQQRIEEARMAAEKKKREEATKKASLCSEKPSQQETERRKKTSAELTEFEKPTYDDSQLLALAKYFYGSIKDDDIILAAFKRLGAMYDITRTYRGDKVMIHENNLLSAFGAWYSVVDPRYGYRELDKIYEDFVPVQEVLEGELESVEIEYFLRMTEECNMKKKGYGPILMYDDKYYKARVTWYEHDSKTGAHWLYFQPKSLVDRLDKLGEMSYVEFPDVDRSKLVTGTIVLAPFAGGYYRGKVLHDVAADNKQMKVYFIDYGNTAMVEIAETKTYNTKAQIAYQGMDYYCCCRVDVRNSCATKWINREEETDGMDEFWSSPMIEGYLKPLAEDVKEIDVKMVYCKAAAVIYIDGVNLINCIYRSVKGTDLFLDITELQKMVSDQDDIIQRKVFVQPQREFLLSKCLRYTTGYISRAKDLNEEINDLNSTVGKLEDMVKELEPFPIGKNYYINEMVIDKQGYRSQIMGGVFHPKSGELIGLSAYHIDWGVVKIYRLDTMKFYPMIDTAKKLKRCCLRLGSSNVRGKDPLLKFKPHAEIPLYRDLKEVEPQPDEDNVFWVTKRIDDSE